jgi:long-chain fatty acid transport protein
MKRLLLASLATTMLVPAAAQASGFYVGDQSAKELGRGFGGGAVAADDPSTIYYNPAGMTELGQVDLSTTAGLLWVHSHEANNGSTRTVPGVATAVPTGGNSGGNPFTQPTLVPSGFGVFRVNGSRVWVGLGVSSSYAAKDRYNAGFFGRYDSISSDVKTVDITPAIGIRLSDAVSIGASAIISQADIKLRNALPNASPLQPDGQLYVAGDDMSFGWDVGILAKAGAARIGANYRSHIQHRLNGRYEVTGLLAPLAAGNIGSFATAPLDLPDIATVSLQYGKRARVMATGKWFNWSRFDRIAITPVLTGATQVSTQNYKDSWSGALGLEYDLSPVLTLRAGGMYETTPTVDAYRDTRVPDGDRTWATGGASFRPNRHIEVSLAYAHVFVTDETVNRVSRFYEGTPAAITAVTRATSTNSADVVSTSVRFRL